MFYVPNPKNIAMCTLICETEKITIIDKIILEDILYCIYKYDEINNNNIYLVVINISELKILKRVIHNGISACFNKYNYSIILDDLKTINTYDIKSNVIIKENKIIHNYISYEYIKLMNVNDKLFLCLNINQNSIVIINITKNIFFEFTTTYYINNFYVGKNKIVMIGKNRLYFYNVNKNKLKDEYLNLNIYNIAVNYKFKLEPWNLMVTSYYKYKPNLYKNSETPLRISNTEFLYNSAVYNTINKKYKIITNMIEDGHYDIFLDNYIELNESNKLNEHIFIDNNNIVYFKLINMKSKDDDKYIKYDKKLSVLYTIYNYNFNTMELIYFYNNNKIYYRMLLNNISYGCNVKHLLKNIPDYMKKDVIEYFFTLKYITDITQNFYY